MHRTCAALLWCLLALGCLPSCRHAGHGVQAPAWLQAPIPEVSAPETTLPPATHSPPPSVAVVGPAIVPSSPAAGSIVPVSRVSGGGGGGGGSAQPALARVQSAPPRVQGDAILLNEPVAAAQVRIFAAGQANMLASGTTDAQGGYDVVLPGHVTAGAPVRITVSAGADTLAGLGFAGGAPPVLAGYALLAAGPRSTVNEGTTLALMLNPNIERGLASLGNTNNPPDSTDSAVIAIRSAFESLATTALQTLAPPAAGREAAADSDAEALRAARRVILSAFSSTLADEASLTSLAPYAPPQLSNAAHGEVVAILVRESRAVAAAQGKTSEMSLSPFEAAILETATTVNQQLVAKAQAGEVAVEPSQLVAISVGAVGVTVPPAALFEPATRNAEAPPGALAVNVNIRHGRFHVKPITPATPRPNFPLLPRASIKPSTAG